MGLGRDAAIFKLGGVYGELANKGFEVAEKATGYDLNPYHKFWEYAPKVLYNKEHPLPQTFDDMSMSSMYYVNPMKYGNRRLAAKRKYPRKSKSKAAKKARIERFGTSQIGAPIGLSNTKKAGTVNITYTSKDANKIYAFPLTNIESTNASGTLTKNGINMRQRDIINLRGFRIRVHVQNQVADLAFCNWAVISPKDSMGSLPDPASETAELKARFFVNPGLNETDRFLDYDPSTLSAMQTHMLPINTSRWTVLMHDRFTLNLGASSLGHGPPSFKTFDKWIPLRRQIAYDGATGTSCNSPVYLVYWTTLRNPATATTNAIGHSIFTTTYFKEPKN